MSFDAEQIEIESGYEDDLLQVVDLTDELMSHEHWQEVNSFLDGLIPDNLLYMCYEDSPEKIVGLIDRLRLDMRNRLYDMLSNRLDGFSLSDRRFEEIVKKRHVARLCLVEKEATQIRFLDAVAQKIRNYANLVVDDDVIGEILQERFDAAA